MEDQVNQRGESVPRPRVNPPPPLAVKRGVDEWKLFKQQWKNYSIITSLDKQSADYVLALFLHSIGTEGLALYNGMNLKDGHTTDDVSAVCP